MPSISAPAATRTPGNPVRRRPVTTFVALAFGIGWPAVTLPLLAGLPPDPFLLLLVFAGLLAPALVVTRMTDGPGPIRKLLSRATMWKFGVTRWVMILLAVPTLTVAIAAVSGTLTVPEGGIPAEAGMYLFRTLIFGALVLNLWEETAWGGFAQTRLMARHGLLDRVCADRAPVRSHPRPSPPVRRGLDVGRCRYGVRAPPCGVAVLSATCSVSTSCAPAAASWRSGSSTLRGTLPGTSTASTGSVSCHRGGRAVDGGPCRAAPSIRSYLRVTCRDRGGEGGSSQLDEGDPLNPDNSGPSGRRGQVRPAGPQRQSPRLLTRFIVNSRMGA